MSHNSSLFVRFLISLTGILLAGACVLQAASLRGTVLDPSGHAVAHARIRIHEVDSGQVLLSRSGSDGRYAVRGLADGSYWLEVEDGQSLLETSMRIRISGDTQYNVALAIRPVEEAVLVLSNAVPAASGTSSKAVVGVSSEEYMKRLKLYLVDGLRSTPGVRVQQLRTPGSVTSVQVRGLRNQDTALLIDGLRFRDAASIAGDATAFLSEFVHADSDRVELLRGSGSSLYGTHAVGGVISVQSSNGGGPFHGELSGDGGGLGSARGLARFGGGLSPANRLLYSGGVSHWNVMRGVDGFDPYRNTSGQGFVRYTMTPKLFLSARLYAGDSFLALNESPTFVDAVRANHTGEGAVPAIALAPDQVRAFSRGQPFEAGPATFVPDFNDPDSRRSSSFYSAAFTLRNQLSPNRSYRATYQIVETRRVHRDGPGGVGAFEPAFNTLNRLAGRIDTFQLRSDLSAGPHQLLTVGYEFEREEYGDRNSDGHPDPSSRSVSSSTLRQSNHALFAQDQLRWNRLQVGVSGRLQGFRLADPNFTGDANPYRGSLPEAPARAVTGDLSLAYFLSPGQTKLRVHGRTGYRAPSPYERFGASFFRGFPSFWGAPSLAPERSVSYDAGIDHWLAGGKARLSATAYYTGLRDLVTFDVGVIEPASDPWGRFGGYRNAAGAISRGMEVDISATPSSFTTLRAAYTYVNSDSHTPTVPDTSFSKSLGVSDHMVSLTAIQAIGRRLDLALDLSAVSSYPLRIYGAPGWLVFRGPLKVDLACTYRIPLEDGRSISLYGKVENLLNRQYYEDGLAAPKAWGIGGLRFRF